MMASESYDVGSCKKQVQNTEGNRRRGIWFPRPSVLKTYSEFKK